MREVERAQLSSPRALRTVAPTTTKGFQMDGASKRVLVVEDDRDTREMLVELLELLGHDVRAAASGMEAVDVLVAYEIDVAFVDIGLPDISGHEVAVRMRSIVGSRELVIAALSGRSQPDDIARSFASGMDLHLVKPACSDDLRRVVGHASGRRPSVGWRTIPDACARSKASSSSTTCACSVATRESIGPVACPPTTSRT
ncbi:MAG: response regulator [Kofleriaceae bacterium]|nr:MAG: response regulator [Kofleriaceae bacterium]MBZ0231495.1 response regulator [Kofleriaceae bacterium]